MNIIKLNFYVFRKFEETEKQFNLKMTEFAHFKQI